MGLAMRSAELAAQMLISGMVDLHELRQAFARLWNVRRFGCRTAALLVSRPRLANLLIPALNHFQLLPRAAMALMGKSVKFSPAAAR
jgi:hypothetical protein